MAEAIVRNVVPNFNYSMKAMVFFRSKIILNKLNIYQKIIFMKFERFENCQ